MASLNFNLFKISLRLFLFVLLVLTFSTFVSATTNANITDITLNTLDHVKIPSVSDMYFNFTWINKSGSNENTTCRLIIDGSSIISTTDQFNDTYNHRIIYSSDLSDGSHSWNVECENKTGSSSYEYVTVATDQEFILNTSGPNVVLNNISDISGVEFNETNIVSFNVSSSELSYTNNYYDLSKSISFYINNNLVYTNSNMGENIIITHPFDSNGVYLWNITVSDKYGNSNFISGDLKINITPKIILNESITPLDINLTDTNNFTINYTYTYPDNIDIHFMEMTNCSLYLNGVYNSSKLFSISSINSESNFSISYHSDGDKHWFMSCRDDYNNYQNFSGVVHVNITPHIPIMWYLPSIINTANVSLIGYVSRLATFISAYAVQGGLSNNSNTVTTTTTQLLSTFEISNFENESVFYIDDSNNNLIHVSDFIKFSNYDGNYFEYYNVTDVLTTYNTTHTKITINPALPTITGISHQIQVYNESLPLGWFNLSLELHPGLNDISINAVRFDDFISPSFTTQIYRDTQAPIINTSLIHSNYTTSNPTFEFNISDDTNLNLSSLNVTLYSNISNILNSTYYNISNVSCSPMSAPIQSTNCQLHLTNISDGFYNLSISINDTFNNKNSTSSSNFIIKTSVGTISLIDDHGPTVDVTNIIPNWTACTDPYFSHYQISVGSNQGLVDIIDWINTTDTNYTFSNQLTPDFYFFNVRCIDTYGNVGNMTSSSGFKVEDNSPPIKNNLTILADYNQYINRDYLTLYWNFTDNESGISKYEYAVGVQPYPLNGWNSLINSTETQDNNITLQISLQDDVDYIVSVRAKNNNVGSTQGWSSWFSSQPKHVDKTAPNQGYLNYPSGNILVNDITVNYDPGVDLNSGIATVYLEYSTAPMNSQSKGECGSFSGYSFLKSLDSNPNSTTIHVDNGFCYRFRLNVKDNANNLARYTSGTLYNLSVDSTAPSMVHITDSGHYTYSNDLAFSWSEAEDLESGIAYYEYSLGTTPQGYDVVNWTSNNLSTTLLLTNLPLVDEQTYYLTVKAYNNFNHSPSISSSDGILYLDVIPPTPVLPIQVGNDLNGSDGWLDSNNTNSTIIILNATSDVSNCVWSFYDVDYTGATSGYTYNCDKNTNIYCNITPLVESSYDVHIICVDGAGNAQTSSSNTDIFFKKDNSGPNITIINPVSNSIKNGIITPSINVSDISNFSLNYSLMKTSSGLVIDSDVFNLTSLFNLDLTNLEGSYDLQVVATDSYNRTSISKVTFIVDNGRPYVDYSLDSFLNSDYQLDLIATLYNNLSYNITDSLGNLIPGYTYQELNSNLVNNKTITLQLHKVDFNDGQYTLNIYANGLHNNTLENFTSHYNFTYDNISPKYILINQEFDVSPNESSRYEDQDLTFNLNWQDLNGIKAVYLSYNNSGVFGNLSTIITQSILALPNIQYTAILPNYLFKTNDTIFLNWHAVDFAGNENISSTFNVTILNRAPIILTTNLSDGVANKSYNTKIQFFDPDLSQSNLSFFNCTAVTNSSLNFTLTPLSSSICDLSISSGNTTPGIYQINVTVSDLKHNFILSNYTKSFNLTILKSDKNNVSYTTSHPTTLRYFYSGTNRTYLTSYFANIGSNTELVPTIYNYTLEFSTENLLVNVNNINYSTNISYFFQGLNPNLINYTPDNLGINQKYEPLLSYGLEISSYNNASYKVSFNYSGLNILDPHNLRIFKYAFNKSTFKINYNNKTNLTTYLDINNSLIYTYVNDFSAFILAEDNTQSSSSSSGTSTSSSTGGYSGGSSGGGGGGGFYSSNTESCTDGIQNQDETGVDCGGSCPSCPSCGDGIQNQGETGIDCGGPCLSCSVIHNTGKSSNTNTHCTDGIQNEDEAGIDCGGSCNLDCDLSLSNDQTILNSNNDGSNLDGKYTNKDNTVSKLVEVVKFKIPLYIWFVILGLIIAGVGASFYIYKINEQKVRDMKLRESEMMYKLNELESKLNDHKDSSISKDNFNSITKLYPEISKYITSLLNKGYTQDQIKAHMLSNNYNEDQITFIFNKYNLDLEVNKVVDYFTKYISETNDINKLVSWLSSKGVSDDVLNLASKRYREEYSSSINSSGQTIGSHSKNINTAVTSQNNIGINNQSILDSNNSVNMSSDSNILSESKNWDF